MSTPSPEARKLLAIPVLVYVEPGPDNPLTNEGFEQRVTEALRNTPGVVEVFVAEDFATTDYEQDPGDDLTAMIGSACINI